MRPFPTHGMTSAKEESTHPLAQEIRSMASVPQQSVASLEELPADLVELAQAISVTGADARQILEPLVGRVVDSTRRRRRILQLVQEALSQLRLDMKYLMFDLEATRRERDDYRQRLEELQDGQ
jgi:hypothetical protein